MESWRGRGRRVGREAIGRLTAAGRPPPDPTDPGGDGHEGDPDATSGTSGGAGLIRADGGDATITADDVADGTALAGQPNGPGGPDGSGEHGSPGEPNDRGESTGTATVASENGSVVVAGDRTGTVVVAAGRSARRRNVPEQMRVPSWLQTGAAWSWRLVLIAVALYIVARVIGVLYIVVVPCTAALLLTALLQPLTARLRRAGLPSLAATWCTLLIVAVVLVGIGLLVTNRVSADYPTLVSEVRHTTTQVESWLAGPPFHIKNSDVKHALNEIPSYLSRHKSVVAGTVLTGGKIAAEFFGGLVLMLFVMFFLIKDGERIWTWLLSAMPAQTAQRVNRAGQASWLALVYYMRGTVAVAAIHALVIGITLSIMGVPLVIPLAIIVFLAAFVPLVGLLFAGALAILVTVATKGWVDALILLCVLIVEDQLEGHLLQPQVVGRAVRLHPLAIILALAVGAVVAGIAGAVVAVPIVAVITKAVPELRRNPSDTDDP
jgi:predicted PurR-regulated permease PerM